MSSPSEKSAERRSMGARLAAQVSRNDEEVRDWMNGGGELWMAGLALAAIGWALWRVVTGG
ncbi:hypothetical protein [Nocardioides sp. Leaf285]|uniref:hypothetical protein n=1 Tax=Nocardioides sp. Leaf285 TaxID=1736322 RepID=UPI0012EA64A3|nr:hypothetical protein [Nocardioides sp. Leaf285]